MKLLLKCAVAIFLLGMAGVAGATQRIVIAEMQTNTS
jgi:hypothetical protein